MKRTRSIASQCKSVSCSSSPPALPCEETLRSRAPKEAFKCASLLNKPLRPLILGYLSCEALDGEVGRGVEPGLGIRRDSKLDSDRINRVGGLSGLREDKGTGF